VPLDPVDELGAPEVLEVLEAPLEVEELLELDSAGSDGLGLESVTYQPEPLKMMPAGYSSRRMSPPQEGQILSGSSWKCCRRSTRDWHPRHSYS